VTAGQEHRGIARRAPVTESVRRRILVIVRLELDDRSADSVDEELRADQLRRDLVDVSPQVQESTVQESTLRSASATRS
jgi:hypothetical protein